MASGTRPVIVSQSPVWIVQISQIMKAQTRDLEAAKADNVKLVERLRYVQGYRSSHHTRAGIFLLFGFCWLVSTLSNGNIVKCYSQAVKSMELWRSPVDCSSDAMLG